MAVLTYNYTWEQGTDLVLKMVYKVGTSVQSATPVDLTGYKVRMDLRTAVDGEHIFTFNSDDIPSEIDVDVTGPTDNEAVLAADGTITITVPRSLTLEGGSIFTRMNATPGVSTFVYDVILRDPQDKQKKILSGTITVNRSVTLWM